MPREHEHEIFDNSKGKSLGKAWWNPDTGHIECSNNSVLKIIFTKGSLHTDDDEARIRNLSRSLKSGYVTAKKVK